MKGRFENSPDLFGSGMGTGTYGEFVCDWCGSVHNSGCGDNNLSDVAIKFTHFGGLQIGEDCFEEVEEAVLRRMSDILPWYGRYLEARRRALERAESALGEVTGNRHKSS